MSTWMVKSNLVSHVAFDNRLVNTVLDSGQIVTYMNSTSTGYTGKWRQQTTMVTLTTVCILTWIRQQSGLHPSPSPWRHPSGRLLPKTPWPPTIPSRQDNNRESWRCLDDGNASSPASQQTGIYWCAATDTDKQCKFKSTATIKRQKTTEIHWVNLTRMVHYSWVN